MCIYNRVIISVAFYPLITDAQLTILQFKIFYLFIDRLFMLLITLQTFESYDMHKENQETVKYMYILKCLIVHKGRPSQDDLMPINIYSD
jgi:hypothetical protein